MKLCLKALVISGCILASGCLPEKRIVWSPDGRNAVVATDTGLRFINSAYKVLPARVDGEMSRAAWFGDNKRLAVLRAAEVSGWDDIKSVLTPDQTNLIRQSAESLRLRILKSDGNWDRFEIDPDKKLSPGVELALLVYVRDQAAEGIKEKVGDEWKTLSELRPAIWQLEVCEFSEREVRPGKVLLRTLEQILLPTVSPDGRNVAYLRTSEQSREHGGLFVVSTSGGTEIPVADSVAMGFAWSADSRSIAYIYAAPSSDDKGQLQLGALATVDLLAETSPDKLSKAVDHAGLIFSGALQVQWLKDGRLMFSSVEVALPVTARDMPQRWSVFVVDPRFPATVHRVLARDYDGSMDMADQRFALSPDEKRVAILGKDADISIYDFASGETVRIATPEGNVCASFPSWRTNDELTFARAPRKESGKIGDVVAWDAGKEHTISAQWPADMTNWLKKAD